MLHPFLNASTDYSFVDDEGGRTADEIVGLDDEDQSLCAAHNRMQAHVQHMVARLHQSTDGVST